MRCSVLLNFFSLSSLYNCQVSKNALKIKLSHVCVGGVTHVTTTCFSGSYPTYKKIKVDVPYSPSESVHTLLSQHRKKELIVFVPDNLVVRNKKRNYGESRHTER